MDSERPRLPMSRYLAAGAVAVGLAAGSYGIASAASGSGTSASSPSGSYQPIASFSATAAPGQGTAPPQGARGQGPWGGQRSDETPLTGDTLTKVTDLAKAKVANATIVRVETDADGHAAYEAHMVKADGTPATVYVDKSFQVVGVETR
jgi:hypothetical protein